jgi:hypothetical protein
MPSENDREQSSLGADTRGDNLAKAKAALAAPDTSAFDRRSAALELAGLAPADDFSAVDVLAHAYKHHGDDTFLAPAIIDALGVLATRSAAARAELSSLLVRMPEGFVEEPGRRYHLVAAAKAIGRVDTLANQADLRALIRAWAESGDAAVQAEARMQLALIALSDALLANDREELLLRLGEARAAFERTAASEEQRPDARLFAAALSALLSFARVSDLSENLASVLDRVSETRHAFLGGGLASSRSVRVALRLSSLVGALERIRTLLETAEGWIHFDEGVLEVATLLADWRSSPSPTAVEGALSKLAFEPTAPSVGVLLARSVSQLRMQNVIDALTRTGARADVLAAARLVARGLAGQNEALNLLRSQPVARRVQKLAARVNADPATFLPGLLDAIDTSDPTYLRRMLPRLAALPLDHPDAYSGDPTVDALARDILADMHQILHPYDSTRWARAVEVLIMLLGHIQEIRDTLPDFTLCDADGGLGQHASERHLQDSVYRRLRERFGHCAVYEGTRIGGGRPDNGVAFPECRFPIEVKHDFTNVSRDHVKVAYLAQADAYAASTDDLAFVLVLDLRDQNKNRHSSNASKVAPRSLYSLHEGAWVDTLPADKSVTGARSKCVVVLLVPGNRPRPSSTTAYSRRPTKPRTLSASKAKKATRTGR